MRGGSVMGLAGLVLSVVPWAVAGVMAWFQPG